MKQLLSIFKFCFVLIICFCFACKKNVARLNIVLYDKPLPTIRQYIQGKWQLIYGKGGISATNIQYYHNIWWEFNDDRIKILGDGLIYVDTTVQWNYDLGTYTNGDSTFLMKFYNNQYVPSVYVTDRIYNDTLILHDNSSDAVFYHFIKSK